MVHHRHSGPAIWPAALGMMCVLLALVLLTPATSRAQSSNTISGVIYLSDGKTLPTGAVFTIQLADVTVANTPAVVVTEQPFGSSSGEPPFTFVLAYDPGRINPSHRYIIQGNIRLGSQILYTTTTAYPVFTSGSTSPAPGTVQITMRPAASGALPQSSAGSLPLLIAVILLIAGLAAMGVRRNLWRAA